MRTQKEIETEIERLQIQYKLPYTQRDTEATSKALLGRIDALKWVIDTKS